MNSDVFFTTGKTHMVCQDYAAVVGDGHIVLSDGCSSSPHTDFGARLLCRTAAQHGILAACDAAAPLLSPLTLPEQSLDATILSAEHKEGIVQVQMIGDGVVVGRKRNGDCTVIVVEYPSGAPRYLSYDLDPLRRTRYISEFGEVMRVTVDGVVTGYLLKDDPVVPFAIAFPTTEYDLILLFSDGVQSFHRPVPNSTCGATAPVPLAEVLAEMLAIKGFVGQFIVRRAKRFLKDTGAKGWVHDDDFSVAALYIGEVQS